MVKRFADVFLMKQERSMVKKFAHVYLIKEQCRKVYGRKITLIWSFLHENYDGSTLIEFNVAPRWDDYTHTNYMEIKTL